MRRRDQALLWTGLLGMLLLVAACGRGAAAQGECLVPEDGKLVPAPCVADVGPGTPTPTSPIIVDNGGVGDGGTPTGSAGLQLFLQEGTCFICHTIDSVPQARGQIGPNLTHVGQKGEAHIRQSILDPDAVIAEECPTGPCPSGQMLQNFGDIFTDQQIDDLVAFLLTLQ